MTDVENIIIKEDKARDLPIKPVDKTVSHKDEKLCRNDGITPLSIITPNRND